ncbi:hypothetical protein D3C78_16810 [compost metagenome]
MNRITNSDKESFSIYKFLEKNIGSCLSWAVTIAWLMFIFCKIYNGIMPKSLNEFGDFVAGAFAPLAFFWLVRGFYQQGKGLEQNSEALRIQALELQSSTQALNDQVVEQRNLLVATKDEIEIIKEKNNYEKLLEHKKSQPFIHVLNPIGQIRATQDSNSSEQYFYIYISFSFKNTRSICREVSIILHTPFGKKYFWGTIPVVLNNEESSHFITQHILKNDFYKEPSYEPLTVEFSYLDALDNPQTIYMWFTTKAIENNNLKFFAERIQFDKLHD